MTQREKDLLLQDLCSRLPYGVKCEDKYGNVLELNGINNPNIVTFKCSDKTFWSTNLDECKPYLFPLSSMTKKQKNSFPFSYSFLEALINGGICLDEIECITLNDMVDVIQGCYENHLDIHGLIPKGLAIDATGLNIYGNKCYSNE
jgi:hypothetical protein